jgi:hypothetical protein
VLTVLPPEARRVTAVAWARLVTMGQPKPPGTAVQVRGAHARHMPAGIVNGDLDGAGVRSQFQCAAAPTVAQGIGNGCGGTEGLRRWQSP